MDTEERRNEARAAIEKIIEEYRDVFATQDWEGQPIELPALRSWILLTCHDDATSPWKGCSYRITRENQWTHESVGLMQIAIFDYQKEIGF